MIITAAFHTFQLNPCRNGENYFYLYQLHLNLNFLVICFLGFFATASWKVLFCVTAVFLEVLMLIAILS